MQYPNVPKVRIDNKKKRMSHIVWKQYTGYLIQDGEVIHHIDRDPFNNSIENLQCMTISEHMKLHNPRDYSRFGVSATENKLTWNRLYKREKYGHTARRMTQKLFDKIEQLLSLGLSQSEIAKQTDFNQSVISRIKSGGRSRGLRQRILI